VAIRQFARPAIIAVKRDPQSPRRFELDAPRKRLFEADLALLVLIPCIQIWGSMAYAT